MPSRVPPVKMAVWRTGNGQLLWRCQRYEISNRSYDQVHLPRLNHLIVRGNHSQLAAIDSPVGAHLDDLPNRVVGHWMLKSAGNGQQLLTEDQAPELYILDGGALQVNVRV
ncbi:MAG: hypothetical protein KF752_01145 [Pirellulaceae bacterium]|nr:hypothetical protein [Pirellulaceae bacterium]